MMNETLNNLGQDAAAVAAVRNGDAERYRELVERHERRVFAVAWSRLGDAALAEEATQEAFIRGYRRLWLLGDGAKFSGWIASVARNAAINLGLRHRRELNKRERWALESPGNSTENDSSNETDPLHTPETLRQTIAELPAAHRECLVLFYIEGKSGTEAAMALGISESALRVRLHRARAVMRERLEEKLEGSLAKLRPSKSLVPAIMAGVFASASAKAATAGGVGATVLGALTKFAPFKWAFVFFPFLFALPMLLVSWLMIREELANYRDKTGFRVRLFRAGNFNRLLWMLLIIVVVFLSTTGGKGLRDDVFLAITAAGVLLMPLAWRQAGINHSRFFVVTMISSGVFSIVMFFVALHWLPFTVFYLFLGLQTVATSLVHGERPIRMDYNLFLRAAEAMLDLSGDNSRPANEAKRFSKQTLLTFGRFLGSRWMADNYRWTAEGLLLRMPQLNFSMWNAVAFFGSWSRRSQFLLTWDGKVSARLCPRDHKLLLDLHPNNPPNADELEKQVVAAMEIAWRKLSEGGLRRAERVLGQLPEYEVFLQSPTKVGLSKRRTMFLTIMLGAMFVLIGLTSFKPPWIERMKPVSISEAQVHAALANYVADSHLENSLSNGLVYALSFNFVLPPTNMMTPESLQAIGADISSDAGFSVDANNPSNLDRLDRFMLALPLANGWFSGNGVGFDTNEIARVMKRRTSPEWQFGILSLSLGRCDSEGETFSMAQLNTRSVAQLRWLRDQGGLDYVERKRLVDYIVSLQVLSGEVSGKRPPLSNWSAVHGLFYAPGWSPLKDTYCSLAALEILDGLDRIDRETCIKRILKLHQSKGFFTPPETEDRWRFQIRGDAQDTLCAFESLRILGALDRVKDLEKWQFRVKSNRASKPDANGVRTPTWEEIEAWVCQQRLERILRERKEKPSAPVRSLLDP